MTKRKQLPKQLPKRTRPVRDLKTPVLIPQSNGAGALLSGGLPGHRGGSGRPPDAFKELCRELASGEMTIGQVKLILEDRTDVKFVACLRWATEHGYGKPKETIDVTSQGEHVNKPQSVDWGALKLVI